MTRAARAIATTIHVAAMRLAPLPLTPRDGAGARRQVLRRGFGLRRWRR